MKRRVGSSLRRGPIAAIAVVCASYGCEGDVSIQLLPGDNQALTAKDAGPKPLDACTDGCSGARALSFKGPYDRVEIADTDALDVPQDFAIEAWVFVKSYAGGHGILNRWVTGVVDISLTFGTPEPMPFGHFPSTAPVPSHVLATWAYVKPDLWIATVAPSQPSASTWHHIASSYGGGSLRLYVDGTRVGSMDSAERIANGPNKLYIGATARSEHALDKAQGQAWWPPIDGYISEVRISSMNRYPKDTFTPERRFEPDTATIALWHLDEGAGDTAIDSGPNHLDGAIVGPQWINAPPK